MQENYTERVKKNAYSEPDRWNSNQSSLREEHNETVKMLPFAETASTPSDPHKTLPPHPFPPTSVTIRTHTDGCQSLTAKA